MLKNKKQLNETASGPDVSQAMATVHPNSEPANDPKAWSKIDMMKTIIGKWAEMDKSTFTSWFNKTLAEIGKEGDVNNGKQSINTNSIKPHASAAFKEDVDALFSGEELSEEFKEKTLTLFEAAIELKVQTIVAEKEEELEKAFEVKFEEAVSTLEETVKEKLDAYFDAIVEQWLEDNEVALVSQVKSSIHEDFLDGLRNLFLEHYMEIPDDKVDLVESYQEQINELSETIDKIIVENRAMKIDLMLNKKEEIVLELSKDLTEMQTEQFMTLCGTLDQSIDVEDFKTKAIILKENNLLLNKNKTKTTLNEGEEVSIEVPVNDHEIVEKVIDPGMEQYVSALSRTARKN